MSFGTFYEVDPIIQNLLSSRIGKSGWYEALSGAEIDSANKLDAEESLPDWEFSFAGMPPPLGDLFKGDLRTEPDGTDDPEVVFMGTDLVQAISGALNNSSKEFFVELFSSKGYDLTESIWLLEPMRDFFKQASSRKCSVIMVWGG